MAELKKQQTLSKKSIVEEFKSLNDLQEVVEFSVFKYFGEGFDFFKRQIAHHHPNLGIDLQGMGIDADLLEDEEKETEEKEEKDKEEQQEKEGREKGDTNPYLLKYFVIFSFSM